MLDFHQSAVTAALTMVVLCGIQPARAQASSSNDADWSSYNRSLNSSRFSPLAEINTGNVSKLHSACTYDTKQTSNFQTGPLEVGSALYGTTLYDTFSIDPNTCRENWRVHETYHNVSSLGANRGLAYLDGRLFRGTGDGRVIAYDAQTGRHVWERFVGDPARGETTPAAPIAGKGLVFIGNAGGDIKGVKGRMYALDAGSGAVKWEFFLVPQAAGDKSYGPTVSDQNPDVLKSWHNGADVPITGGASWTSYSLDPATGVLYVPSGNPGPDFVRDVRRGSNLFTASVVALDAITGAYKADYPVSPGDTHDWDVSSAPALINSPSGHALMAVAPKDGRLYGFDLASGRRLYRQPVTRVSDPEIPLSTTMLTHFCPGTQGGSEWNGAAYDPQTASVLTGEVDWCASMILADDAKIRATPVGKEWTGSGLADPHASFGQTDPQKTWAGWLTASDVETGRKTWQVRFPAPVLSGITPTAGGLVFAGDMNGDLYGVDARTGHVLWTGAVDGAAGGGIITYKSGGTQKLAVASGMVDPIWPTKTVSGKIVIFELPQC